MVNLKFFRNEGWLWKLILSSALAILSLPLISILSQINLGFFSSFFVAFSREYTVNTLALIIGSSIISLIIGVSSAWIVSQYRFPFSGVFRWLLVMPLAFPSYILAYTYKGIFGLFGSVHQLTGSYFEIDNIFGLIFIFSISLYPYIYIVSRISFSLSSGKFLKTASSLGAGSFRSFFTVALPLCWPAIFGGLLLVVMEILNNFGAVQYYGVKTFTTEIVRLWNPMNLEPIHNISSLLVLFVIVLIFLEKRLRKGARFMDSVEVHDSGKSPSRKSWLLVIICASPIVVGFILPLLQLIYWSLGKWQVMIEQNVLEIAMTTFIIGLIGAFLTALLAFLVRFIQQFNQNNGVIGVLNKTVQLGYTIPGALLGVGMLTVIFWVNDYLSISLTSSLSVLIVAYIVRFYSVSMSSIHGGFEKLSPNIGWASLSLGKSLSQTLGFIHRPILGKAFIAAIILVFVDVVKELPLTMMFQRFNFETLAVKSYKLMITDGAVYDASLPSLLIVLISAIPIYFLDRWIK